MLTGEAVPGFEYIGNGRYRDIDRPHVIINTQHCVKTLEENKKLMERVSALILTAHKNQWLREHGLTRDNLV